jgi:sarcosine oxidase subunit beta
VAGLADVVVIGGGVHGASVAYHLARGGAGRVVLLERRFLASGPTGRSTALVRRFYGIDVLTRTASAAADLFRSWDEAIGGDPGYREVGFLVLAGPADASALAANATRARGLGARVERLSAAEAGRLVPGLVTSDVAGASFEVESGYADPVATTQALARRAQDLGASVIQGTGVAAIDLVAGRVAGVRTTDGQAVAAPVVVVCAGLGAPALLLPLGLPVTIRPTRHQMCVFQRPEDVGPHPAIADGPNRTYMRPEAGRLTLHGLGSHEYDEVVDPDDYVERADAREIERNAELVVRRLPAMTRAAATGGYAGVYDTTPDRQPVLGPVTEIPGLYLDFGWSGHGFKHAPVIGAALADAVLGRPAAFDLRGFRWARFREGDLWPAGGPAAPPHPKLIEEAGPEPGLASGRAG